MPMAAFRASPSPGLSEANDHNLEDLTSVLDVFWIFFVLSALQPVIRQRLLDAMLVRKIAQLERDRHSLVTLLAHRQETMKPLGFPVMRYIDVNDSEEVLRAIHMTDPDVPLDLVLHTPGGLVLAALQIARAIRGHKGKVMVCVPHYAMSGGPLIALAADEIVMSRHAVLRPDRPSAWGVASGFVAHRGGEETHLRDRR
jgi:ClpP class serine protease